MSHDSKKPRDDHRAGNISRRHFLSGLGAGAALLSLGVGTPAIARAVASGGIAGVADRGNTLIVYLTRTNNTKAVADIIHHMVGGTVVEVEPAHPYPEDYAAIVAQVDGENERGYMPALKTKVDNMHDFDTVFFGFPTWDMQLPPPMKRFLRTHDLSGKTVIPFNTNGGFGVGSSFRTIEELCPDAHILRGFFTRGGLERDGIYLAINGQRRQTVQAEVVDWLQRIQIRL